MSKAPPQRCAIYTRKSSDGGLDQAFNSLDAQREAGEAYIKSQASEGWHVISTRYDDGGYSGGTMERPALMRLMADVDAGLIDVVVVYKIDRLTRSLADFARIVERFDAQSVSFVSVTQSFNTTSSMGRLTLNVLLSFAQFEREVTGERIRDKIAASKAKGMWMGGIPPLGFDVPAAGTRTLQVNPEEAVTVRRIYERYLEIGSVHRLADELEAKGITSKVRITGKGKQVGGTPLGRGALFHILRNPIYLGKIVHKGAIYEGEHDPIIDEDLFDKVQQHLAGKAKKRTQQHERPVECAPLTGRLFDTTGEVMSPTFSRERGGRIYRYYVSTSLQRGKGSKQDPLHAMRRVPAAAIEHVLSATLKLILPHMANPLDLLIAAHIHRNSLALDLPRKLAAQIRSNLGEGEQIEDSEDTHCTLTIPVHMPLRGGAHSVTAGQAGSSAPDATLIAALRRAHSMTTRDKAGCPLVAKAPISPYDRKILRLAFLCLQIQRDILEGRQQRSLNLQSLMQSNIPLDWAKQRQILGWSQHATKPVTPC